MLMCFDILEDFLLIIHPLIEMGKTRITNCEQISQDIYFYFERDIPKLS